MDMRPTRGRRHRIRTAVLLVSAWASCWLVVPVGAARLAAAQPVGAAPLDGRALFVDKGCAGCHAGKGPGPDLTARRGAENFWAFGAAAWNHAPAMRAQMAQGKVPWPSLSPDELGALVTFLGIAVEEAVDANLTEGKSMLVRKGCLRCHALAGEGARIGPDLTRGDYRSAVVWLARLWNHAPSMGERFYQMGIPYPLFTGPELRNLFAYLRPIAPASR